jgi:hypothetical protein
VSKRGPSALLERHYAALRALSRRPRGWNTQDRPVAEAGRDGYRTRRTWKLLAKHGFVESREVVPEDENHRQVVGYFITEAGRAIVRKREELGVDK